MRQALLSSLTLRINLSSAFKISTEMVYILFSFYIFSFIFCRISLEEVVSFSNVQPNCVPFSLNKFFLLFFINLPLFPLFILLLIVFFICICCYCVTYKLMLPT